MFPNTMNFRIDSAINAMAVSRDGLLAVAGRSLLKIYSLADDSFGTELFNLRSSNFKNLNFSNNDVTWCPLENDILATAATNGAVVVWNLQHSIKNKIGVVFNDHKRTVNKVCFQSNDPNTLLSGSQDGCMKLFDLRKKEAVATFVANSESVRDVQFSPYWTYHFASVQETGNVEIWDIRKPDKPECNFIAHDGPVFACEWHPNQESFKWLATGGRDKTIKVWDLSNRTKPTLVYNVHTIMPVSRLKWRPDKDFHIGSCSLVVDFSVYVWDIKRPYVPFAIFGTRKERNTTGFAWKNDPFTFITTCKDGTIFQHRFEKDAYYPAEHYPPIGIDLNPHSDVAFSTTDFIYRYSQTLTNSNHGNMNYPNPLVSNSIQTNKSTNILKTSSLFGMNSVAQNVYQATSNNSMIQYGNNSNNFNQFSSTNKQPQTTSALSSSLTNSNVDFANYHSDHRDSGIMISASKNSRNVLIGSPSSSQYGPKYFPITTINNQLPMVQQSAIIYPSSSYNISVPLSYRKTHENILEDHFRCMISYMMLFPSNKFPGISPNLKNEISMQNFIITAQKYLLSYRTFEELCEHNAQIADSLCRYQIGQTWRMIRHMFSIVGRHPTSSGGGGGGGGAAAAAAAAGGSGNNPSGGSIQNIQPISDQHVGVQNSNDFKFKNENPSRNTSGSTRHFSGNNSTNHVGLPASVVKQLLTKDSKDPESEEKKENMETLHGHFPSLKQDTMPSNKFVVDFFDFQPNQTEQEIEQRPANIPRVEDDNNPHEYELNCQEWELQRESIFHRHNIAEYSIQMNPELNTNNPGDNSLITNYDANSSMSFEEDDEMDVNLSESPGFFNVNLQALLASKNPPPPAWSFIESVGDMLRFYADIDDVQTTVSLILVLGERMKQISNIEKSTINIWFRSYIDLLHRFRLWNISTRIIQISTDSDIQSINQTLTSVLVYCAYCFKPIRHGSAVCEKCRKQPTSCTICHVSVRGLYVWCQGCAHGGHLQHMIDWFKTNSLCPAGCGHQCEYC